MQQELPQEQLTHFEQEWFADHWGLNRSKLLVYARKKLNDIHDSYDVLGDLAVQMLTPRIYRMMGDYPSEQRFRRMAFHCLKYLIGNRLKQRKQRHFPEPMGSDDGEDFNPDPIHRTFYRKPTRKRPRPRAESSVVEFILRLERKAVIQECLNTLTDRQRQIVWLTVCVGETLDATANRLGLYAGYVAKVKGVAIEKLRSVVPDWLRPEETLEEAILRLYQKGIPVHVTAKRVGCSKPHAVKIVRKHGLPTDRRVSRIK